MCQSRSLKEVSFPGYNCFCQFCLCGSGAAKTEVLFSTVEILFSTVLVLLKAASSKGRLYRSQYRKAALSITGNPSTAPHHHSGSLPAPYMTSSNLAKGNDSTSEHLPPLFHCPKIPNKAHLLLEFTSTRETKVFKTRRPVSPT